MTKSKREESEEVKQLKEQLREQRRQERRAGLIEQAKTTLAEYGQEYETAKRIFFAVNGARRVLKSA